MQGAAKSTVLDHIRANGVTALAYHCVPEPPVPAALVRRDCASRERLRCASARVRRVAIHRALSILHSRTRARSRFRTSETLRVITLQATRQKPVRLPRTLWCTPVAAPPFRMRFFERATRTRLSHFPLLTVRRAVSTRHRLKHSKPDIACDNDAARNAGFRAAATASRRRNLLDSPFRA